MRGFSLRPFSGRGISLLPGPSDGRPGQGRRPRLVFDSRLPTPARPPALLSYDASFSLYFYVAAIIPAFPFFSSLIRSVWVCLAGHPASTQLYRGVSWAPMSDLAYTWAGLHVGISDVIWIMPRVRFDPGLCMSGSGNSGRDVSFCRDSLFTRWCSPTGGRSFRCT